MRELTKNEMLEFDGGIELTSTLIATLIKGSGLFFEIGKSFGSSMKRLIHSCPINT